MRHSMIRCPSCGDTTAHHRVARSLYSPSALVLLGGPLLALVFDRSRKQQFRCEKCGALFATHTVVTRIFQIFWVWAFASIAFLLLLLLFTGQVVR
jgi:uncharacterized Zn finger protein